MTDQDFKYRGHTLEELQEMQLSEFAELLTSDKRRKINRGLQEKEKQLLEKIQENDYIETHQRDMIVLPSMIGTQIGIYNGQGFEEVEITEEMLGHYLGELAKTRKKVSHSAPGLGATRSSKHVPLK